MKALETLGLKVYLYLRKSIPQETTNSVADRSQECVGVSRFNIP